MPVHRSTGLPAIHAFNLCESVKSVDNSFFYTNLRFQLLILEYGELATLRAAYPSASLPASPTGVRCSFQPARAQQRIPNASRASRATAGWVFTCSWASS